MELEMAEKKSCSNGHQWSKAPDLLRGNKMPHNGQG
jgi:hypothetical protein